MWPDTATHSLPLFSARGAEGKNRQTRIYIGVIVGARRNWSTAQRTPVCVYLCLYTSTPPFASASKSPRARPIPFALSTLIIKN
jgi:hypothetical protein